MEYGFYPTSYVFLSPSLGRGLNVHYVSNPVYYFGMVHAQHNTIYK